MVNNAESRKLIFITMKVKSILFFLSFAFVAMAFIQSIDNSGAKAEEQNGIKIFAFSKPSNKYDILGMVKIKGIVKNEKAPHMVELLVGYAKKDFPSAQGIIINSDFEKAEVIKFKD